MGLELQGSRQISGVRAQGAQFMLINCENTDDFWENMGVPKENLGYMPEGQGKGELVVISVPAEELGPLPADYVCNVSYINGDCIYNK